MTSVSAGWVYVQENNQSLHLGNHAVVRPLEHIPQGRFQREEKHCQLVSFLVPESSRQWHSPFITQRFSGLPTSRLARMQTTLSICSYLPSFFYHRFSNRPAELGQDGYLRDPLESDGKVPH